MKKLCKREIFASEISEYLGVKWGGKDFLVTGPATLNSLEPGKFVLNCQNEYLTDIPELLVIAGMESDCKCSSVIHVKDPEIAFYKAINEFFMDVEPPVIDKTAFISPSAKLSRGVTVCKNTVIGSQATIGANTYIGNGVIIKGNVHIGKNCIVKDNAVIGSEGYHFIDDGASYLEKPCLGSIQISDNVLIGSNTSIELPLFEETVISSYAKIDDLVNIGSNCNIGLKARIAASSILCHNVTIGENCFIGAGAVIRDDIHIGAHSIVGIGAVVLNTVDKNRRVAGNPAHEI